MHSEFSLHDTKLSIRGSGPIVPKLHRLMLEGCSKTGASLGYRVRPYLKDIQTAGDEAVA